MADIPGLEADVYFGDAEEREPSVTDLPTNHDEDQDEDPEVTAEEKKRIKNILGFDPSVLDE